MKNIFVVFLLVLPFMLEGQLIKTLKKTVELKMPGKKYVSMNTGLDSLPGTRGGAVAWHPIQKKYYAAFAGNDSYPLAVFNASGKLLSDENLTCMADLRGLWYNPTPKKIYGNGYSNVGWFSYNLDSKGIPTSKEIVARGMNQPGSQCIGTFDPNSNVVCFLEGQFIYTYGADAMMTDGDPLRLYPGTVLAKDIDNEDDGEYLSDSYSSNVLLYTGISKAEFGLLNVYERQVELYNRKTGLLTKKLKLPSNLKTWPAFNFSYANGIFWAFDQDTRTWTGYK